MPAFSSSVCPVKFFPWHFTEPMQLIFTQTLCVLLPWYAGTFPGPPVLALHACKKKTRVMTAAAAAGPDVRYEAGHKMSRLRPHPAPLKRLPLVLFPAHISWTPVRVPDHCMRKWSSNICIICACCTRNVRLCNINWSKWSSVCTKTSYEILHNIVTLGAKFPVVHYSYLVGILPHRLFLWHWRVRLRDLSGLVAAHCSVRTQN